ncbi:hypothetical protein T09_133 [Trichinella sp. T9]|nr:hypothetical protein T09_133 [Trichinella sp. T9]
MKKTAISRIWRTESEQQMQFSIGIAARRLNPNTNVQRYVIQYLERISSNFIFNNLTCHFSSSVHDHYSIHSHVSGDAHVQLLRCSSITSMNKHVENDDDTLIVDYIDATIVTAETGIKPCPAVPACFHKVKFQSHGKSLRFCAYLLVADRKDTNVAEAKTFRPTTLLMHPGRSGYD